MILHCSKSAGWRLLEPDDFRSFKVVLDGVSPSEAAPADGVSLEDGTHAWIRQDVPARLAGAHATPAWQADFERMVAFAGKHGWLRDDGAIRAHIETAR
jgi:hypothetical protein